MIKINGQTSLFLKDLLGNEFPAMAKVNRKKRVNGQREISLSFIYDDINADSLHDIEFGWKILFKDEWYTITNPSYNLDGDTFNVGVDAVLSFFVDMNGHYLQDEAEDKSMTPFNYFTSLFKDTDYNFVIVDELQANTMNYQDNQTKTERFLYGIDRFKAEYVIRGKVAYIHTLIGSDKDVILHEDLNIKDISIEIDGSGFHTWAKGFGDKEENGEDEEYKLETEYASPLHQKHGYIEGPAIRDGKYKKESALKSSLKKQVENSYKVSTSISAIDLTNNGYAEFQLEEGDRIYLYVTDLKQNQQVRVVEMDETFDWEGNVIDVNYTLGNEAIATRYKTQQYNSLKDFSDIINGRKKIKKSWLDDAIQRAADIINGNSDSMLDYGFGEIIGINQSNPNGYMRFNTDGLGFSRDGGKTYRTAMTYEGIVADSITAGTLRSIYIEGVEIRGSEIYGGYIEGATIVSKNPDKADDYVKLQDSSVTSYGTHLRDWVGSSTYDDVSIGFQNGQMRARNHSQSWSLFFNDWGISTFADGDGNSYPGGNASGIIEFHSYRYSGGAYRGLTLMSYGRTGIESSNPNGARIYLNPNGASVRVSDYNDNYYNIAAAGFNQSSRETQKRDIKLLEDDALSLVLSLDIMEYKRLTRGKSTELDQWQAGLIVEETASELLANGDSVDLYSYVNYISRAMQQHYELTNNHIIDFNQWKSEKDIKIEELEERIITLEESA